MHNEPDLTPPDVDAACGGVLPDLCNDTLDAHNGGAIPKRFPQSVDLITCKDKLNDDSPPEEEFYSPSSPPESEPCLTLLACDIANFKDLNSEGFILNNDDLGVDLIKQNLLQATHPLFSTFPPIVSVPDQLLAPVMLNSHGMSLGCLSGPSYGFETRHGSAPPLYEEERPHMSEEEQIKIAKRLGLIHHLPCGIFDGNSKTRECVICMIDFSDGDKVRYLPCMHTYHTECIDDWLMRSFTCPSCLQPVDAALLKTYETS